jgi:glycosyltransferase involved in cell wall biosynthesis
MPAREAFTLGRLLVAPSRAESLPYIILETAAAGVPMITTNVGGIPEVFGPQSGRLIPRATPSRSPKRSPPHSAIPPHYVTKH